MRRWIIEQRLNSDLTKSQETVNKMDVEPLLIGNTPGCSNDAEHMDRELEWPTSEEVKSKGTDENNKKEDRDGRNMYKSNYRIKTSEVRLDRTSSKTYETNIYRENKTNSNNSTSAKTYETNIYKEDKTNSNLGLDGDDATLDSSSVVKARNLRDKGIRIIENRQLVPPYNPGYIDAEWTEVASRKRYNQQQQQQQQRQQQQQQQRAVRETEDRLQRRPLVAVRERARSGRRLIKPAVVTITGKRNGPTYAQILSKARGNVNLKALGIQTTVIRRAVSGAIVIEVPGPHGKQLAATLKNNLESVLGEDARVTNPVAVGELRLRGIEPSTTQEDILEELEAISGTPREEFKVSAISIMRDGLGMSWVSCPLQAAVRVAERGALALGWTRVKVELLQKRPVQCYKCWHYGHVRLNCRSEVERKGSCYKCGNAGHTIKLCKSNVVNCLICKEKGHKYGHKMGSMNCLRNQGYPRGIQPVRKIPMSVRKTSQASTTVFEESGRD